MLLALTLASAGPGADRARRPAARRGRGRSAQRPAPGDRALAAGDAGAAAAAYLAQAGAGEARDTAFYNAGTAALEAGRYDVARGALAEATKSLDPGLRYRALYNLGSPGCSRRGATPPTRRRCWREADRPAAAGAAAAAVVGAGQVEPRARRPAPAAAAERRGRRRRRARRRRRGQQPEPSQAQAAPPGREPGQAEQILNSMEREERATRSEQQRRYQGSAGGDQGLVTAAAVLPLLLLQQGARPELEALGGRASSLAVGDDLVYSVRAVSRSAVADARHGRPVPGSRSSGGASAARSRFGGEPADPPRSSSGCAPSARAMGSSARRARCRGAKTVVAPALVVDDSRPRATASRRIRGSGALLERAPPPASRRAGGRPRRLVAARRGRRAGGRADRRVVPPRAPGPAAPPADAAAAGDRWRVELSPAGPARHRGDPNRRRTLYDLFVAHQVVFPLRAGRVASRRRRSSTACRSRSSSSARRSATR